MPIVEEYDAIAKRMRELRTAAPQDADEIAKVEKWRDSALDVARAYIQKRRREMAVGAISRRRPLPTD